MSTNAGLNGGLVEEALKLNTVTSKIAAIENRLIELQNKLGQNTSRQSAQDIVRRDRDR